MYSRKYIRPAMAAGGAPSERLSPPPDYAGVAFRNADARNRQDFPETVIPAVGAGSGVDAAEPIGLPSEPSCLQSNDTEGTNEAFAAKESEEGMSDGFVEEGIPIPPEPIEAPQVMPDLPDQPPDDNWGGVAQDAPSSQQSEGASAPPSTMEEGEGNAASSPIDWLRELKMEDFLLLWLLLMLLYGQSNEEIDLLLGLLLFAGR